MSLPEEIIEIILARVSRWNYPKLSLVSKTFHSLLSSMDIYKRRSEMGTTETCLYICLELEEGKESQAWFTLQLKPNGSGTKLFKQNSCGNVLVPIVPPSPNSDPVPFCSTSLGVGSEIYIIGGGVNSGPSSTVLVLDCRSHTWRNAPNMKVARSVPEAVSLDEKIYVMGGYEMGGCNQSANWVEVFDTKTQSWTSFPSPCDEPCQYPVVNVIQGKLYMMTESQKYIYDPKQDTWKVVREPSIYDEIKFWCVVENVICCCTKVGDCMWYDIEGGKCEMIKGLEKLREHPQFGLSSGSVLIGLFNYGDNLLVIWETEGICRKTKVWYAEISLETRCNGSEVWGKVEWVDIMYTRLRDSYEILDCCSVSV